MEKEVRKYLDDSANNMACSIVDISEAININKIIREQG